jgi:[NiFe] hydrogenase diaphorase moiety small subunit
LIIDHNRCILCKRCIRRKKEPENPTWFVFENRGDKVRINFDKVHTADMDDEIAQKAMDTCPVGAIIRKEKGYDVPIGQRRYDKHPIGEDIEGKECYHE